MRVWCRMWGTGTHLVGVWDRMCGTSCIGRGGRVPRTGGSGVGGGRGMPIRRAVGPVSSGTDDGDGPERR